MDLNIIKVLIPWVISFILGFTITPLVISYLHKYKAWRKEEKSKELKLPDITNNIQKVINRKTDFHTPRMGGLTIVISVILTTLVFWTFSFGIFGNPSGKIDFLSRSQTWVPFATFVFGAILGFLDDLFTIKNIKVGRYAGFPMLYRVISIILFSGALAFWFYYKLDYNYLTIPFYGNVFIGLFFIPFFIFVIWSFYATSNIDGLDGLSGGIMTVLYSAIGFIAFEQQLYNISAFSFVVAGATLSFLWFNIKPAKYWMTEVGYTPLSVTLAVLVFLTKTVFLMPIIAIILFVNLVATTLQLLSIRLFKKRIFKAAPLHHHLELSGWSESQIVMRYWIITIIAAIFGIALTIISI